MPADERMLQSFEAERRKLAQATCSSRRQTLLTELGRAKDGRLPRKELETLLDQLQRGVFDADETYTVLHIFGEAGFVDAMLDVEKYLGHDDSELRSIALSVLFLHWSLDNSQVMLRHAACCKQMLLNDPDDDVRRMAASSLGACYSGSDDPETGQLLAELVHNDSAEIALRETAYKSLFEVRGVSPERWPTIDFKFPDEVEWKFVDSFM